MMVANPAAERERRSIGTDRPVLRPPPVQSIRQTRREWARILLASEASASTDSARGEPVTVRVYESLRNQLCLLLGAKGFHAVASRALILAKSISPSLIPVQIAADGSLSGLIEVATGSDSNADSAAGLILIAELLGFLTKLLGETATLQLIADVRLQFEAERECNATAEATAAFEGVPETSEPIRELLREIDRLRSVGDRMANIADKHVGMEAGLITVAENIRSIATILDIFALIRSQSEVAVEDSPEEPSKGYVM